MKLQFKDIEIGEFFKEDHEGVYEFFQKVSLSTAVSQDDGHECLISKDFPVLLLGDGQLI